MVVARVDKGCSSLGVGAGEEVTRGDPIPLSSTGCDDPCGFGERMEEVRRGVLLLMVLVRPWKEAVVSGSGRCCLGDMIAVAVVMVERGELIPSSIDLGDVMDGVVDLRF